jgi:hypothetical protein
LCIAILLATQILVLTLRRNADHDDAIFVAAAAALDAPAAPTHGIYSYSTTVEFLMRSNASQAPVILSVLLAKLVLDEPTIIFNGAGNQRLNHAKMPLDKATFDKVFSTTSASGHLTCRFEIQFERRTFHPIKMGTWDILQKYGVLKSAAPVKEISLAMMGFWVKVHPSFASAHVFRAEICNSIQDNYNNDDDLLEKVKLDRTYNAPEIYLKRHKLTAPFHSSNGTTSSSYRDRSLCYLYRRRRSSPCGCITHDDLEL